MSLVRSPVLLESGVLATQGFAIWGAAPNAHPILKLWCTEHAVSRWVTTMSNNGRDG